MNKQIEEIKAMARAIYETGEAIEGIDLSYACLHGADTDSETKFMRIARHLYRNEYRKSTDVAREICQDIIEPLWDAWKNDASQEKVLLVAMILETINYQIKKKYESKGGPNGSDRVH